MSLTASLTVVSGGAVRSFFRSMTDLTGWLNMAPKIVSAQKRRQLTQIKVCWNE
jgi:hypothetical protein